MSDISERFTEVFKILGITGYKLSELTGKSNTKYDNIMKGSNPTTATMAEIKEHFPSINLNYCVSGQGNPVMDVKEGVDSELLEMKVLVKGYESRISTLEEEKKILAERLRDKEEIIEFMRNKQ